MSTTYPVPEFHEGTARFSGYITEDGYLPALIIYGTKCYTLAEIITRDLPYVKYASQIVEYPWYQRLARPQKDLQQWSLTVPNTPDIYIGVYFSNPGPFPMPRSNPHWESPAPPGTRAYYQRRIVSIRWMFNGYEPVGQPQIKKVPLSAIDGYPRVMSKGISGCIQQRLYAEDKFWDPANPEDSPMLLEQLLEQSARDKNAIQACIASDHCGRLYQAYTNGTLDWTSRPVELIELDGTYYYDGDGSHRICLLKRIGAEEIEAKVTVYRRKPEPLV